MSSFDLIVLGKSPASMRIALAIASKGKKVGLVGFPENPETYHQRLLNQLLNDTSAPPYKTDSSPESSTTISHPNLYFFEGEPRFESRRTVRVEGEILSADRFVVASGVHPMVPDIPGLEQVSALTPFESLLLKEIPSSVAIIGPGPIGVGLAERFAQRGSQVTLIGRSPSILRNEDVDVSNFIHKKLLEQNIQVLLGSNVRQIQKEGTDYSLLIDRNNEKTKINVKSLILATGFQPNTRGLNLKAAGVYINDQERVAVNEEMQTSSPGVWALGAVTGTTTSFGLESYQAELISNNILAPFFAKQKMEPDGIYLFIGPSSPPFVRIGLTEPEAQHQHKGVFTVRTDHPNREGFIKLIGKKRGQELLGVHVVGKEAGSLGLFFQLALRAGISLSDISESRYYPPIVSSDWVHASINNWVEGTSKF